MTPDDLIGVVEATWPPAGRQRLGAFLLRDGRGGGKRVSAASLVEDWTTPDLDAAEAAMQARGQAPLFQVLPGQEALDAALDARGYAVIDPVLSYAAPVAALAVPLPKLSAFAHWPPLEIAREIWAEAGIGPARIAVMERAEGAKAVILARHEDRPVGVTFVALSGAEAMVHALEVRPDARRKGVGGTLVAAAAGFAAEAGAQRLSLVVTEANGPARALYAGLGMREGPGYHYREKKG